MNYEIEIFFTETEVLVWAYELFNDIKLLIDYAINKKKDFIHFNSKDENMADFKIDKDFFEITSAKLSIFKHSDGKSFEFSRMNNKNYNPEIDMTKKYLDAFEMIEKKSNKKRKYKQKERIIVWFDRNIINGIFSHSVAISLFIKNNYKYVKKITKKFKNIYFIGEARSSWRGDFLVFAEGIKIDNVIVDIIYKTDIPLKNFSFYNRINPSKKEFEKIKLIKEITNNNKK